MTRTAYYTAQGPTAGKAPAPGFATLVRHTLKRSERMVGGLPAGARFSLLSGGRLFTATGRTCWGRGSLELLAIVVGPAGGEHKLDAYARVRVHYLP